MKTTISFALFFFVSFILQAQNYEISFTASGSASSIDSIYVENLSQGTTLMLNGDDVLHLVVNAGIHSSNVHQGHLNVYPNPMSESSFLEFNLSETGRVDVEVFSMNGALIAKECFESHDGLNRIEISDLRTGVYTVMLRSGEWRASAKLISLSRNVGKPVIQRFRNESELSPGILKCSKNLVQMQYNDGERILFKAYSGNFKRVSTLLPTQTQTVDFEFIPCTDQDGNNYAVVTIGSQTWMAENLTVTKLNDGTLIPLVSDPAAWINLTTPGYCWFDNNQATFGNTYGALYNWYTVNTLNLCPTGWHVPTDAEWTQLTDFLGGEIFAGGKLKDMTHWMIPCAVATNETGYSALPGGRRTVSGGFDYLTELGYWWSNTEVDAGNAYYRKMDYDNNAVGRSQYLKILGLSVRCIRD